MPEAELREAARHHPDPPSESPPSEPSQHRRRRPPTDPYGRHPLYLAVCTLEIMDAREHLIESTQELLWERGYVATSPKAIQSRAGVGQGSMYHHFEGKQALAATAVRRSAAELQADVQATLDQPGGVLERLCAYLVRERDALRGCRIGGLTQDPEIIADDMLRQPLDDTFAWLRGRLADLIAEGQASGELQRAVSPDQLACMICAVVQGGYVLARAQQSQEPFRQAVTGAVALLATLAPGAPTDAAGSDRP
jgi:TetR/AcrR family transcriptional repressor of nem operon